MALLPRLAVAVAQPMPTLLQVVALGVGGCMAPHLTLLLVLPLKEILMGQQVLEIMVALVALLFRIIFLLAAAALVP